MSDSSCSSIYIGVSSSSFALWQFFPGVGCPFFFLKIWIWVLFLFTFVDVLVHGLMGVVNLFSIWKIMEGIKGIVVGASTSIALVGFF
jgi:hypothetical protein